MFLHGKGEALSKLSTILSVQRFAGVCHVSWRCTVVAGATHEELAQPRLKVATPPRLSARRCRHLDLDLRMYMRHAPSSSVWRPPIECCQVRVRHGMRYFGRGPAAAQSTCAHLAALDDGAVERIDRGQRPVQRWGECHSGTLQYTRIDLAWSGAGRQSATARGGSLRRACRWLAARAHEGLAP